MIEKMIVEIKKHLPLTIVNVEWSGDIFTFSGSKWSFSTVSAWRIVKEGRVDYACFDKDTEIELNGILGKEIINISFQSVLLKIDPVFFLSDGRALEIFATDTYEPWTFHIDELGTYVATPSDPAAFDI